MDRSAIPKLRVRVAQPCPSSLFVWICGGWQNGKARAVDLYPCSSSGTYILSKTCRQVGRKVHIFIYVGILANRIQQSRCLQFFSKVTGRAALFTRVSRCGVRLCCPSHVCPTFSRLKSLCPFCTRYWVAVKNGRIDFGVGESFGQHIVLSYRDKDPPIEVLQIAHSGGRPARHPPTRSNACTAW